MLGDSMEVRFESRTVWYDMMVRVCNPSCERGWAGRGRSPYGDIARNLAEMGPGSMVFGHLALSLTVLSRWVMGPKVSHSSGLGQRVSALGPGPLGTAAMEPRGFHGGR